MHTSKIVKVLIWINVNKVEHAVYATDGVRQTHSGGYADDGSNQRDCYGYFGWNRHATIPNCYLDTFGLQFFSVMPVYSQAKGKKINIEYHKQRYNNHDSAGSIKWRE